MEAKEQLFTAGLVTETTPDLQPPNSVRDMMGMRITSLGGDTYRISNVRGNDVFFTLSPNYQPIGWASFGDKLIIQSTNANLITTFSNGEFGYVDTFGVYTPIYNHQGLKFSLFHQIESLSYAEGATIETNYWTDNFFPDKAIRFSNPIFHTNIPAIGGIVVGKKYMVLQGSVTYNGSVYGVNNVLGTVFTGVVGFPDYTLINPVVPQFPAAPIVIDYYPIEQLDANPPTQNGILRFKQWLSGGAVTAGRWQFAYQLSSADGALSPYTYVTRPVSITRDIPGTSAGSTQYSAYQGKASTVNTNKAIRLSVEGIDTNFTNIRVVAIKVVTTDTIAAPILFFDGAITGANMDIDFFGNENLGSLVQDDIMSIFVAFKRVKTMATNKNYLFKGNLKYQTLLNWKPTGVTIDSMEYLVPSDILGAPSYLTSSSSTSSLAGQNDTGLANVSETEIYTDQWYQVTGGVANYNGVDYGVGQPTDVFQGFLSVYTWAVTSGVPLVRPVLRIQRYTGVYDIIPMTQDWRDSKGMTVDTLLKSRWRQETYREGILLYDTIGNPMFVHWIGDKTMPAQYELLDSGGFAHLMSVYPLELSGRMFTSLRHIGLKISNIDFNQLVTTINQTFGVTITVADLPDYIGGFSIVHAPLERTIVAQGLLWDTYEDGLNTRPEITPTSGIGGTRSIHRYLWFAPDFQFRFNGLPDVRSGDYLKLVAYLNFTVFAEDTPPVNVPPPNIHYYDKYYTELFLPPNVNAAPFGAGNDLVLEGCFEAETGATVPDPTLPTSDFINVGNAGSFNGVGGRTFRLATTYSESGGSPTYPDGYGYFAVGSEFKPLVNLLRANNNLYGGTGDNALANTKYIYAGHYQPMDAAFMGYLAGTGGIANDIEVFGGDCNVVIHDTARAVWATGSGTPAQKQSFATFFPCECAVNTFLREGRTFNKDRSYDAVVNINGIAFSGGSGGIAQPEEYLYNSAYSEQDYEYTYNGFPVLYNQSDTFKWRFVFSQQKINGERFDSFRIFRANSFKDLNGFNGSITNLRTKNEILYYFQQRALGYIPINERVAVANQIGQPLNIGEGGVAQRYDDRTNFYGNETQWGLGESDNAFYWYCLDRRLICEALVNGSLVELSTIKGITNTIYNLQPFLLSLDNPVTGNGVTAAYDHRYHEVIFSFLNLGFGNLTIAFNTKNRMFSGKYPYPAKMMVLFNDFLISTGNSTLVNKVYTHNDMGNYGNFYGIGYDAFLSVVINHDRNTAKWVNNFEAVMGVNFWDTIEYFNREYSATDSGIITGFNTNFVRVYDRWQWNTGIDPVKGRIIGSFMEMLMKNTYATDQSKMNIDILSIISYYEKAF